MKQQSKAWEQKVREELANYGYQVKEIRDDGVLCKTRYGKYILVGYSEKKANTQEGR